MKTLKSKISTALNNISKKAFGNSATIRNLIKPMVVNLLNIITMGKGISVNIVNSLKLSKQVGAKICGVVGRDGGYTAIVADACVIIPTVNDENVTPHTEGFQALVWHLLVSHPKLQKYEMKWESVK